MPSVDFLLFKGRDLNLDLSAKPLKLSSPAAATTESQVWEPAEEKKYRLHSSKVDKMFASLLAEEIHCCSKKRKKNKSQNKTTNKTNLILQALGTLLLRLIMQKLGFFKDTTRLRWTNPSGTGRLAEKAFRMGKVTFQTFIPTERETPRLYACWDTFSFHFCHTLKMSQTHCYCCSCTPNVVSRFGPLQLLHNPLEVGGHQMVEKLLVSFNLLAMLFIVQQPSM